MSKSLKDQTISGMIWSAVQRFGLMFIIFFSNLLLARLLTPEDFGCIGMIMVFIAIANTFVDGGFGAALIQKERPTQKDYSTIFFWNLAFSIILYIILYLSAPAIARFYSIPILCDVLRVQGVVLIVNALQIVQSSQVRKVLNFKRIAGVWIFATIISAILSITLAYKGFGVWSIVAQYLAISFFTALFYWILSKWRPSFIFSWSSFRELFNYGFFLMLNNLLQTLLDNVRALVIGKVFLVRDLGFYTQARKMEEIPVVSLNNIVSQVSFPVFSKIQNDHKKIIYSMRKTIKSLTFINFPLMILLIVIAEPLFILLLTDKWLEAVPYFQILCLSGLSICMSSVNYSVIAALGESKPLFYWNIVKVSVALVLLYFGMRFGMLGVLYSYAISTFCTYIINTLLLSKYVNYGLIQQIKDTFSTLMLSVLIGCIVWYVKYVYNFNNSLLLLIQVPIYIILFGLISRLLKFEAYFIYKETLTMFYRKYRKK